MGGSDNTAASNLPKSSESSSIISVTRLIMIILGVAAACSLGSVVWGSPLLQVLGGVSALGVLSAVILLIRTGFATEADDLGADEAVVSSTFDDPLFRASPIGIARLDPAGRIIDFNEAFALMLGLQQARPDCPPFIDFVVLEDHPKVEAALRSAAQRQNVMSAPEPSVKPTEVTLTAPRNLIVSLHIGTLPGQPHMAEQILHLIDVTAFKDLENQILQSRKMQAVGQLAGGIAHDFNNLLTAMIGFCDLLLLRHRAGDQSFADIMQIKQNANRAASLVRQLLAFSRQQTLRPRVLDITDTLTELSHLLRRLIGQTVVLKMVHGRDLGLVKVDQGQFEQVVINLAVNARDAMPNGGSLTIKTQNVTITEPIAFAHETMPPAEYVQIEVIDSGTGIEDGVISRIFEPFFTTKPVGSGTGLGLSTVYGIVRQTDGFIAVKSALGHGTLFTIYLPRYAGPAQIEERADETERADIDTTGTGTILLVEDEDPVRLFTGRALRNKGYRVLEARSGEAAIQLLDGCDEQIDMLITDAVMPVIDGPTLIKLVRQHRPEIKVICISGHTDEALRASISSAGDVLFLAKPFSLKQLATCVKERLAGGVLP